MKPWKLLTEHGKHIIYDGPTSGWHYRNELGRFKSRECAVLAVAAPALLEALEAVARFLEDFPLDRLPVELANTVSAAIYQATKEE